MRRRRSLHYSAYTLNVGKKRRRKLMPRYLIERTFPGGLKLSNGDESAALCAAIVFNNAEENVTWIHSYVSNDRRKTFCIYDAPSPEEIGRGSGRNNLPVDRITKVSVLDPYFLH